MQIVSASQTASYDFPPLPRLRHHFCATFSGTQQGRSASGRSLLRITEATSSACSITKTKKVAVPEVGNVDTRILCNCIAGAHGILVCYDMTDSATFSAVER